MLSPLLLCLEFARTQQADDPFAFQFAPQDYTLRAESGVVETVRIDWNQQLRSDLAAVRLPGRDPSLAQKLGNQLRSILRTDIWHSYESQIVARSRSGGSTGNIPSVILTIRSAAAEIYALPWELLILKDTRQPVGALRNVLLRYEWPDGTEPPAELAGNKEQGRILFAWSAAAGSVPASEHGAAIERAARDGFLPFIAQRDELGSASCGRLTAVLESALQGLRSGGPPSSILHLLCHGTATGTSFGLALDGDDFGEPQVAVDAGRLSQLLAPYAGMVRLVVLMACDSGNTGELGNQLGSIAQLLHSAGFAQVVASRFPLSVAGSIRFTETFYKQLLMAPASVEQALLATRRELLLDAGQLDWASLQLYARARQGCDNRPILFRPYRGLLAYESEQRRFFFGRTEELREILEELQLLVAKKGSESTALPSCGRAKWSR